MSLLSVFVPDNGSSGSKYIYLKAYGGWKGVESMVTPLDEYVKSIKGTSIHFSDLFWPLADAQNPYRELLNRGIGVVAVTILSVNKIYRHGIYAYIVYKAKVDKVIINPQNTMEQPTQAICVKDPKLCDSAERQHEIIDNLISEIKEDNIIKLIVPAFIAVGSLDKANLTVNDIATPFPLLAPGYKYLVFIEPELDGIHVNYDYVWGPWAYLILEGKVYSLNYVKPHGNVSLDPLKLFESPYIHWKPYPYKQLREIAIQKLSVNGEPLDEFIEKNNWRVAWPS
ncbi:MAG: hypothetical protein GSR87_02170 [Desulfurococcales archaeon]|nr:hypothetical protein [Desulfurococcales archaeon]